jgi:predicted O-linked N-acetylglucosamine transferase (SPINDLY family)
MIPPNSLEPKEKDNKTKTTKQKKQKKTKKKQKKKTKRRRKTIIGTSIESHMVTWTGTD